MTFNTEINATEATTNDDVAQGNDPAVIDAATTKKLAAQSAHIARLEQENKESREALDRTLAVAEELKQKADNVGRIDSLIERLDTNNSNSSEGTAPIVAGLSSLDVTALVDSAIKKNTSEAMSTSNMKACMQEAADVYGKGYMEEVNKEATRLSMSIDDVDSLAKSNPTLFKHLFVKTTGEGQAASSFGQGAQGTKLIEGTKPGKSFTAMTVKERMQNIKDRMASL